MCKHSQILLRQLMCTVAINACAHTTALGLNLRVRSLSISWGWGSGQLFGKPVISSFFGDPPPCQIFYFEVTPPPQQQTVCNADPPPQRPYPLLSQQIITLAIPNGFQNVIKNKINKKVNKKDETMIIKKVKKIFYFQRFTMLTKVTTAQYYKVLKHPKLPQTPSLEYASSVSDPHTAIDSQHKCTHVSNNHDIQFFKRMFQNFRPHCKKIFYYYQFYTSFSYIKQ